MEKIIITMPYIDRIIVAQKIRAKYHNKIDYKPHNIHGKVLGKRLSSTLYNWDINGYLVNKETNEKVISNPKKAGEAREWVVNFQAIYNGSIRTHVRNNYLNKLKELLSVHIDNIYPIIEFPLQIELFIYAEKMPVDVDNKGVIYHKIFQDLLTNNRLIPDDSSEFIQDTGRTKWIKVGHRYKEKMEFHITKII